MYKTCDHCGATNDPLNTACLYCGGKLPYCDLNKFTNEELILLTAEWVEKARSGNDILVQSDKEEKLWSMPKFITREEVSSYAQKYLTLLKVRSYSDRELVRIVLDFEDKISKGREEFKLKVILAVGALLGAPLLALLGKLLSS